MKTKLLFIAALFLCVFAFAYKSTDQNTKKTKKTENAEQKVDVLKTNDMSRKKVLVVYYSYSGNTKQVAKTISSITGGDIFEITTENTYPQEYNKMVQQAKQEIADKFRPQLTFDIANIDLYNIVFIGSPNWWGTITPQVSSFLDNYDLSGKTVIPFITHGGGGEQNTIKDLTSQCKGCKVSLNGWTGYGKSTDGLEDWLKKLGFGK